MPDGGGETPADKLPTTIQLEAQLLAALMVEPESYDDVAAKLRAEHFSEPFFGIMFDEMGQMASRGEPANPITLGRQLAQDSRWEALGGGKFWMNLTGDSRTGMAFGYVDHIIDVARRRGIIHSLHQAEARLADLSHTPDEGVSVIETALADTVSDDIVQRTYTMHQAFSIALDRIEKLQRGEIDPGVMVDDFQDWNDITGGMRGGDLIYIAGRPSMGKTALLLRIIRSTASAGHGVLLISREMDVEQLMPRILADMLLEAGGGATFPDIKAGKVSPDDMRILSRLHNEVREWPLVIADPPRLASGQIAPLVRRHARAFERRGVALGLVAIDYLGLIEPPQRVNREQEVSAISVALKDVARSNRVPVIVLSQLSRAVEQREDKRPQLSDLRDSGSLEQDADIVVFVYRDEYYLRRSEPDVADGKRRPGWEEAMRAAKDRMEIFSAKNRQGDLVRRKAWFFGVNQAVRNSDHYMDWGRQ